MPNFETTYDVESKTYAAIFHTAWHLLDMGERHEEGRLLNFQAATVFFAFTFEAYLIHRKSSGSAGGLPKFDSSGSRL